MFSDFFKKLKLENERALFELSNKPIEKELQKYAAVLFARINMIYYPSVWSVANLRFDC